MPFRDRQQLEAHQLSKLNSLLRSIRERNSFYAVKFDGLPEQLGSLAEWSSFPMTSKRELSQLADSNGLAPHHTFPAGDYIRLHRTSGTTGRPLIVMDRREDWEWWLGIWKIILDTAELRPGTVVFMAFSFGPFIGFWSANDACLARGCRVIPGGGLSTAARLDLIQATHSTALFCTPSYALHLADEARQRKLAPSQLGLRKIVVAGEPGGSLPAVRQRIEEAYAAEVVDHAGATEIGPWGVGTIDGKALEVIESEFIAEFLPFVSPTAAEASGGDRAETELFELVLTGLGRAGAPALRYRTGDLVRPDPHYRRSASFVRLEGGVLGRVDQMITIRGVNVFPSSIESILQGCDGLQEYRLVATRRGAMDHLQIEVEEAGSLKEQIEDLMDRRLGLRVEVINVAAHSLPRSTDKSKRFLDRRHSS
jgi:phenylacetate-CoA ligase